MADTIISNVSSISSSLWSSRSASDEEKKLVTRTNSPEMEIACPACPSLMRRSAAIGLSRLTGRNSAATSAKAASDIARTAPYAARGSAGGAGKIASVITSAFQRIEIEDESPAQAAFGKPLVGDCGLGGRKGSGKP